MKLRKLLVAVLAVFAGLAQAQQMPTIPSDPDVRVGKLDNGLTYYIRHNNWPENRADFYIAQKVGSIQEEESQRGLAHFLEHMCFNGTKHFPGNEVMRYCESIGVKFGADLNAYTSIDQTVYNISNVPTARQSALDSCLLILSDWSNALLLDPKEIDEERGVIHEEWRLRTSASSRMFERNLPKLYPGSRINLGVVIALALTVVYAVVIRRTRFGYHLRALGGSQRAAEYSGVNKNRYYFLAMLISGAFCGLAGAVQISGNTRRLMEGVAGDFGFSGIVVAMLGSLHPVGIVIAALFMALISAGSVTMQVKTGIPVSFTSVLEALIVLFILLGMAVSAAQSKRKKVG